MSEALDQKLVGTVGRVTVPITPERPGEVLLPVRGETEAEAFRQRALAEAARDTTKYNTEAEANRRRTLAEAEAEATKVHAAPDALAKQHEADGDAYAQRIVAAAEAEAINVRAGALSDGNQALIAANKLVESLPVLVEAAAQGIAGSNLTVLNGSEGVNQLVAGMVGQGLSIFETLRRAVATPPPGIPSAAGNGAAGGVPTPAEIAAAIGSAGAGAGDSCPARPRPAAKREV